MTFGRAPSAANRTVGWVVGVMVHEAGAEAPVRLYFAVARPDQARAEWAAVDLAVAAGRVATSPVGGVEPVQAVGPITATVAGRMALAAGAAKALGPRSPRRWLS